MIDQRDIEVSFSEILQQAFRDASGDVNPLHEPGLRALLSPSAAPIVFGMLQVLRVFTSADMGSFCEALSATITFPASAAINERYPLLVRKSEAQTEIRVGRSDAPTLIAKVSSERNHDDLGLQIDSDGAKVSETWEPYTPDTDALKRLKQSLSPFGVVSPVLVLSACWCSYMAGVRLGLDGAIILRCKLRLFPTNSDITKLWYFAEHRRLNGGAMHRIIGALRTDDCTVCLSELDVVGPNPIDNVHATTIRKRLRHRSSAQERVAVVTGCSRGLGLAFGFGLPTVGYRTIGCHRNNHEEFAGACELSQAFDAIHQGDCADIRWCESMASIVEREFGKVNLLICNAWGSSAPPASGSKEHADRLIEASARVAMNPLRAFLGQLNESAGQVVLVSSVNVEKASDEDDIYVHGKRYAERLFVSALMDFERISLLIARPPAFRSPRTRYIVNWNRVRAAEDIAVSIIERILSSRGLGQRVIMNSFP